MTRWEDRSRRLGRAAGWVLLGCAALAVRLVYLRALGDPGPLEGDARNYDAMVQRLLAGGGYGYWPEGPDAYVTPGFPLFLAAVYVLAGTDPSPLETVRIVQAALGALTAVVFAVLGRRVAGGVAGWVAGIIVAFYPPFIWSTGAILTEVLALFALALFLLAHQAFWERPRPWAGLATGGLLAAAILVRPQFVFLLPLFAAGRVVADLREGGNLGASLVRVGRSYAWVVAGAALAMSPWWVRNVLVLDDVVLLATQTANPILGGVDPYFRNPDVFAGIGPDEQMQEALRLAAEGFRSEPWLYLKWFTVGKLGYIFGEPYFGGVPHGGFLGGLAVPLHWTVLTLGSVGLALARRESRLLPVALGAVGATLVQLAFIPQYRYAYPIVGLLAVSAGALVAHGVRAAGALAAARSMEKASQ